MGKIRGGSFEILYYFKIIGFYLRKRKVSRIELLSVPAFPFESSGSTPELYRDCLKGNKKYFEFNSGKIELLRIRVTDRGV